MDPNSSTTLINDPDYSQFLTSLFEHRTDALELGPYFNGENGNDDVNNNSGSLTSLNDSDSSSDTTSSLQPVDSDDSSDEIDDSESESDDDSVSDTDDNSSEDGETNDDKEAEESVDEEGELNVGEIDGLFCPICFEAWSSGGDHAVCCLPCGHIYGLSCIKKWLQGRGLGKCPHCKKNWSTLCIRLLYAGRIVAVDEELQKKNQALKAECASLKKQSVEWQKKEAAMSKELRSLKEARKKAMSKKLKYFREGDIRQSNDLYYVSQKICRALYGIRGDNLNH